MAGTIGIVVDIYSGRRNPTIDLSASEMEELRHRLEASRRTPVRERHERPQLGYRGFVIYNEARETGLPYRAEVFGGFVAVTEERPEPAQPAPQRHYFKDADQIEEWLLERAAERGLADDIVAMGGPYRKH
jgi:hypothetical protein